MDNNPDKSKKAGQGFAGLEALLPGEISQTPTSSTPSSVKASEGAASTSRTGAEDQGLQKGRETSPPPNGATSTVAWQVLGVVAFVAVTFLVIRSASGPASQEDTAIPPSAQTSGSSEARSHISAPSAEANALIVPSGEQMPSEMQRVLSPQQTRWCIFEFRRVQAMIEFFSGEQEQAAVDGFVDRYNKLCTNVQLDQEHLVAIEAEVNTEGRRLQGEGVDRILAIRVAQGGAQQSAEAAVPSKPAKTETQSPSAPSLSTRLDSSSSKVEIRWSQFGLFHEPSPGKPPFQPSSKVPLREGQRYGWVIFLRDTESKVNLREEFVLPARPKTLAVGPQSTVSPDGKIVTTEREVFPENGLIYQTWIVAPGDPTGRHIVRVYINNQLARIFEFEAE